MIPYIFLGFPVGISGKQTNKQTNLPANAGDVGFDLQVGMIPWRRKRQPTPVFLPGKFQGQSGLVGYSPWGRKELDTTECIHIHKKQ